MVGPHQLQTHVSDPRLATLPRAVVFKQGKADWEIQGVAIGHVGIIFAEYLLLLLQLSAHALGF